MNAKKLKELSNRAKVLAFEIAAELGSCRTTSEQREIEICAAEILRVKGRLRVMSERIEAE